MSKKGIDSELLKNDIKSVSNQIKELKKNIKKAFVTNEIYTQIEHIFKNHGYVYSTGKDKNEFTIIVSSNFSIVGQIDSSSINLEICILYDGIEYSFYEAQCGKINIPITGLELYMPLIEKMIIEGKCLTEKYNYLHKKGKSAELLESLVRDYVGNRVKGDIGINSDQDGVIWLSKDMGYNVLVRVPLDFDNYESQIDAWLRVVNDYKLWRIEHKDTKVQVLESYYPVGIPAERWDMATGEHFFNIKI